MRPEALAAGATAATSKAKKIAAQVDSGDVLGMNRKPHFTILPRREAVIMRYRNGNAFWHVTQRRIWLCWCIRVETIWGDVFYTFDR